MRSRTPLGRRQTGVCALAILATILITGLPAATPGDAAEQPQAGRKEPAGWFMLGGNPTRNMVNLTARNLPLQWDIKEGKNILWTADLGSRAYAGPAIARGKVFVGTNNQRPRDKKLTDRKGHPIDLGVLMAFEQSSGKFLWQSLFRKLSSGLVNDWPRVGLRSTPTIDGDRMYYVSNRAEVVCSDLAGKILWKLDMIGKLKVFPHSSAFNTDSSVLVVGDALYLVTMNGVDETHINVPAPEAPSFLKLSKKDGKVLWQDSSPTIKFAQVKKGQNRKGGFKNLVNGAGLIHHSQWSNPAYAVVAGQPQVVFPGGDGWIYSFTPEGKLLWKFDCNPKDAVWLNNGRGTRSDFLAMPVIYKDRVYIGVGQDAEFGLGVGHLWCIDMKRRGDVSPELVVNANVWPPITNPNPNSAKVWHYGGPIEGKAKDGRTYHFGRTMSTCAIHEDLVYTADLGGRVYCLDANNGKVYWQHDTRDEIWSSPLWADGKVYLGTEGGSVFVFAHGKKKTILAENDNDGEWVRSPPVAVGSVLYMIAGHKLVAIGKKN